MWEYVSSSTTHHGFAFFVRGRDKGAEIRSEEMGWDGMGWGGFFDGDYAA